MVKDSKGNALELYDEVVLLAEVENCPQVKVGEKMRILKTYKDPDNGEEKIWCERHEGSVYGACDPKNFLLTGFQP